MPDSQLGKAPPAAATFKAGIVQFISDVLPGICGKPRERFDVDGTTPLFESGLIDSLAIIHLIAFVEQTTGRTIPPRMVVMKYFRCVDAICGAFGPAEQGD